MKQLLLGLLLFVFAACAPATPAPTIVAIQPTWTLSLTVAPTQVAPTAMQVLPTDVPTTTTVPTATELPTATLSPTVTLSATVGPTKVVEPAKNKIVFTSNQRVDGQPSGTHLFLMNPDGSDQKFVRIGSPKKLSPSSPTWSPDGRKIAFSGATGCYDAQIYIMNNDGSDVIQITNFPVSDYCRGNIWVRWSPNGEKILFVDNLEGKGDYMYVMDADGKNLKQLPSRSDPFLRPSWSPDSRQIIFTQAHALWVMNADGSDQKKIYACNHSEEAIWSHDMKKIYYSSNCAVLGPAAYGIHIRSANAKPNQDGNVLRGGKDNDLIYNGLTLSPDGQRIAFEGNMRSFNVFNIFVMDTDGLNVYKLTNDGWNNDPAWSPVQ